jgi:hypothetical protein
MKVWNHLYTVIILLLLSFSLPVVAQDRLSLSLQPDVKNPTSPTMGDHLKFWSTITNTGSSPIEGLVAWISLIEIDPGNEQPVDLEDWSAHKAVSRTSLQPGQSLRTDWPMRLIKSGDYLVVISVTDRQGRQVYTSPTVQFHVQPKPVLQAGRVLLVAATIPLLFIILMIFNNMRQRSHREK